MFTQGPMLRRTGAWLLAMLVGFAVTLLWLPRIEQQGRLGPDAGLAAPVKLQGEKGSAQRSALAAKPAGEDRSPGPQPNALALAPPAPGIADHGQRLLARPVPVPCPAAAPCGRHAPRAPPLALA